MEQIRTVTSYTIPGKAPVIVTRDELGFIITHGKWLEIHKETEHEAETEAYKLANIERVAIKFVDARTYK
jgi:hypothetical protein